MRVVLALILFVAACECADKEMDFGDCKVHAKGKSGKFTLTCTEDGNVKQMEFEFDSVKEVDADGNAVGTTGQNIKHSFQNFAQLDFNSGEVTDTTLSFDVPGTDEKVSLDVKQLVYTATFGEIKCEGKDAATFKVTLLMFKALPGDVDEIRVKVGEAEFTIKKNMMKFNLEMNNWCFCGEGGDDTCMKGQKKETGERVEFQMAIKGTGEAKSEVNSETNGPVTSYSMGDSQSVVFLRIYTADGEIKEMPEGYPKFEKSGSRQIFTYSFGKGSKIFYDPIAQGSSAEGIVGKLWVVLLMVLLAKHFF